MDSKFTRKPTQNLVEQRAQKILKKLARTSNDSLPCVEKTRLRLKLKFGDNPQVRGMSCRNTSGGETIFIYIVDLQNFPENLKKDIETEARPFVIKFQKDGQSFPALQTYLPRPKKPLK